MIVIVHLLLISFLLWLLRKKMNTSINETYTEIELLLCQMVLSYKPVQRCDDTGLDFITLNLNYLLAIDLNFTATMINCEFY